MHLIDFRLLQFKNYADQRLTCDARLNCYVGPNGAGKTNLLEAIYYLCLGKSYWNHLDTYLVRHGDDFFRLEGRFSRADQEERVVVKYRNRQRKEIERNGTPYQKLSEHVGRYPVVIVTPDDTNLISEGSEARRRLLDNTLSQTDERYLQDLLQYNRLLRQRNALLKSYDDPRRVPEDMLGVYDLQMAPLADRIGNQRQAFVVRFNESLTAAYASIAADREAVRCTYKSQLNDTAYAELMAGRREKDKALQRTTAGPHRDDLVFTMNEHPLKRVASQGQLKSFVLALKLAQYQVLRERHGLTPLLLLDDIFDKLDGQRVQALLDLLLQPGYGQIFLTDTDPLRIEALVKQVKSSFRIFAVNDGAVEDRAADPSL
jgi:DNA replication and repair protein RecF